MSACLPIYSLPITSAFWFTKMKPKRSYFASSYDIHLSWLLSAKQRLQFTLAVHPCLSDMVLVRQTPIAPLDTFYCFIDASSVSFISRWRRQISSVHRITWARNSRAAPQRAQRTARARAAGSRARAAWTQRSPTTWPRRPQLRPGPSSFFQRRRRLSTRRAKRAQKRLDNS